MPKENSNQLTGFQTQCWEDLSYKLERIREAAEKDKRTRFTTLMHHITPRLLLDSYQGLRKDAASGVDEVTWDEYGEGLARRLLDLHDRVQSGRYKAKPSKRIYIPKPDGRQRPIGIAALEDKIVQAAVRRILESIYETDFRRFSYGFRPGRSQHDALDAVWMGIKCRRINWILDADIKGFFDNLSHEWLMKFLEIRIADRRMLRLVRKWLKAGISEDGEWSSVGVGVPQGAVISPLLANIYLHYALDRWMQWWRQFQVKGHMIMVRYADDFIVGFRYRNQAERFYAALKARMEHFGLELQEQKTRIIEFGRYAASNRARRGERKPETFDFLGFTHMCGKTRKNNRYVTRRKPMAKKLRAKLRELKEEIWKRRHLPVETQGRKIRDALRGVYQYYAVPGTTRWLAAFRTAVRRHWWHALRRRSQRPTKPARIIRWLEHWVPKVKIAHPYPDQRLSVAPSR
jgi:group II intron reverse transcriptase/maturase